MVLLMYLGSYGGMIGISNGAVNECVTCSNDLELDGEYELNQPNNYSDADKRCSQIFLYMLEIC